MFDCIHKVKVFKVVILCDCMCLANRKKSVLVSSLRIKTQGDLFVLCNTELDNEIKVCYAFLET